MDITFRTKKLQKACSSEREMRKEWGDQMTTKLMRRLAELEAAANLEVMRSLPAARCHELREDRRGQLAVDLVHPFRLIFIPDHDPVPKKSDGGLDWQAVTRIEVIEIGDYH